MKWGIHIVLILLLLAIPIVSSPDFDGTLSVFSVKPFQREFVRFCLVVVFFYLNLFVLLPKFFSKQRTAMYWILVLISFAIVVIVPNLLTEFVLTNNPPRIPANRMNPGNGPPRNMLNNSLFQKIFSSALPFLFSFLLSMFLFRNEEKKELEKQKAKADLLNLKYQLQPHFLFNILNSIYSLALLKSDDAPKGILKLSNVMRYVVQKSGEDLVLLEKELNYLKDYISIQLIRTDESLDFSYTEIGEPKQLKIAPLILVNFIENAFKYGFNAELDSKIMVSLSIENEQLTMEVFNRKVNQALDNEIQTKFGLRNTLERLKQIYPQKHSIQIKENEESFEVNLKMQLE